MSEHSYGDWPSGQMDGWTCRPGNTDLGKQEVMLEKNPYLPSDKSMKPRDSPHKSMKPRDFPYRHYTPIGNQDPPPSPSISCSRRCFLYILLLTFCTKVSCAFDSSTLSCGGCYGSGPSEADVRTSFPSGSIRRVGN